MELTDLKITNQSPKNEKITQKNFKRLEALESGGGGGTVLVASLTVAYANLPASAVGQIHFITDGNFGGTKGQPVVSGGSTLLAVIWNGSDWLLLG